jgi:hypothetical protein
LSPYAPKYARERYAQRHAEPPDDGVSLQPAPTGGPGGHVGDRPVRPDAGDPDLERLEASLRWLQRQEAATRFAREPRPLVAPARHAAAPRYPHGERGVFQTPPLPEPAFMPPPPAEAHGIAWRWPLLALIAAGIVAPASYYFFADRLAPPFVPAPSQLASPAEAINAHRPVRQAENPPAGFSHGASGTSVVPPTSFREAKSVPSVPAAPPAPAAPAVPPVPAETAVPPPPDATDVAAKEAKAPPPEKPVRAIDPEQIALLLRQGEQLVAAGDLAAARTLFQRAADGGDVNAAVALAATYDPNVLAGLGVVGVKGDVGKARAWYQKAESMGSAEATRRLRILAKQ